MKTPVEELADLIEDNCDESFYVLALAILGAGYKPPKKPSPTCLVCGIEKEWASEYWCGYEDIAGNTIKSKGGRHTWKERT